MISFGQAKSSQRTIIAGLCGPTGSGKSCSALELGSGLVKEPGRELFMIDTEFGRGAHYAENYSYQYGQLDPPFTPNRYIEAIEIAIAAGAKCVIVDSLSHMWEGPSGLLDWHGDIVQRMAQRSGGDPERFNFPAWREPKQALQQFVLYLQRCPIHLILCMRAKPRSKMVKVAGPDGRTKTDIVDAGLQPIIDTATPYEATFLAMLSPEEPGVPHWTHKALASYLRPMFDGTSKLSREHGRRLAKWCGNVDKGAPPSGERAELQPPAATTAAGTGRKGKATPEQVRDRFMASLESANDVATLAELDNGLVKAKDMLGEFYASCATALQDKVDAITGRRSFHDEIDDLEPDEWKNVEGRVDDPRQPDLIG